MTFKSCSKCGESKSFDDFHRSSSARDGKASWCKKCVNNIRRDNRKKTYTPENKRKWQIRTRYGLTIEQVEELRASQGGSCAVCKKELKKFHIDHDHNTGKVRGLLCHRCNVMIGGWDDKEWLNSAMRYMGVST